MQPGFQYAGISSEIVNISHDDNQELKDEAVIQIFSIPLKVGFRMLDPEESDKFNVRIFAGFDGHHVVGIKYTEDSGNDVFDKDNYSGLIMNADFGMGVDVLFTFVDAGYQLGLSPVRSGADKAKANSFYINAGLKFSF